jgi:uncharacterized protein (TIGR00255 family)
MTGFGSGLISRDGREITLELKSVNHRFLDLNFRLAKSLSFAEEPLRNWIRDGGVKRGHLEISVNYRNNRMDSKIISLDRELLELTARETGSAADALHREGLTLYELIKLSDALSVTQAEEDAHEVLKLLETAFADAQTALQTMREREGKALQNDLELNLRAVRDAADRIAGFAPAVPQEYRERLNARLKEWNVEIADPARVAQEVALLADKCAIDEELSRLQSHFRQFEESLAQDGEAGRRMDFLLQEINREVNTIGSKASHMGITKNVVEMKSLLEKLREQVQNVE